MKNTEVSPIVVGLVVVVVVLVAGFMLLKFTGAGGRKLSSADQKKTHEMLVGSGGSGNGARPMGGFNVNQPRSQ